MANEFIFVKEIVNGLTGEYTESSINIDHLVKANYYPEKDESILWLTGGHRVVIEGDIMQFFTAVGDE